jgi:hypothetical protein
LYWAQISHWLFVSIIKVSSCKTKFVPNPVVAAFEMVKFPDATVTSLAKLSAVFDNLMVQS